MTVPWITCKWPESWHRTLVENHEPGIEGSIHFTVANDLMVLHNDTRTTMQSPRRLGVVVARYCESLDWLNRPDIGPLVDVFLIRAVLFWTEPPVFCLFDTREILMNELT